jgi:hypothetical protein
MTSEILRLRDFLEAFEEKAKESMYEQKKNIYRIKMKKRQSRIVKLENKIKNSYLGGAR